MQDHSTATSKPTFRPRVRRLGPGRYLVESATKPGTGHPVTASSCNCPGFAYRGTCRHIALVKALEPAMERWYDQAATPAAPVAAPSTDLDQRLAQAYRALADTDRQADEYAVYLHEIDLLERAVAADNAGAMRAA